MKNALLIAGICVSLSLASVATTKSYVSPDKLFRADVITQSDSSEAVVEIHNRKGDLLSKEDYSSDDQQHGYYVSKAKWTPNSLFFVYSLERSGGHSVMVIPTLFFSVEAKKTYQLFDFFKRNVIFPDFTVISPDKVKVTLQDPQETKVVSLSKLLKSTSTESKSQ